MCAPVSSWARHRWGASNNDLDMFEAMRSGALLHKHERWTRPRSVRARSSRWPRFGARALGMETRIGSLEPKKRADLITVAASGARQTPMDDPLSHLVYVIHGDDVRNTIVNGRVLMRDRKVLTLDEAAVVAEARSWADKGSRRGESAGDQSLTSSLTTARWGRLR